VPNPWDKGKGPTYSKAAGFARKSAVGGKKPQGESILSNKLRKDLGNLFPSSLWWKNAGSEFGEAGLPDVMGCINGSFVAIEVKKGKGWFSPLQVRWLKNAEKAGAISIGLVFQTDTYIVPISAMGTRGNRHKELWIKIEYPDGLKNIHQWRRSATL